MPLGPNSQSAQESTRQRILKAAITLFSEVGYEQATTHLIAELAEVNEVTLFRQFGSKKALLMACVEAVNQAGFAETFETGLSGVYSDNILHMAQRLVEDMRANVELLRMLVCDARNIPELREVLLTGSRGNQQRLSRFFARQIEAGAIRPELSAEALSIAFESLFSWSILFEYVFRDNPSPRLTIDELIRPLVDLFVTGTERVG